MSEQTFETGDADIRFLALVWTLSTAAWAHLGKTVHPVSQKLEKDLDQAKTTIDFLRMLLEKTRGNLKPKEQEMLRNTVTDLELNFADEAVKPEGKESKAPDIIIPSGASKAPEIVRP